MTLDACKLIVDIGTNPLDVFLEAQPSVRSRLEAVNLILKPMVEKARVFAAAAPVRPKIQVQAHYRIGRTGKACQAL